MGEVWDKDLHSGIFSIWMAFQSRDIHEIFKAVHSDRRDTQDGVRRTDKKRRLSTNGLPQAHLFRDSWLGLVF